MILVLGGTSETGVLLRELCLPLPSAAAQTVLLCTATQEELSVPQEVWQSGRAARRCGRLDQPALEALLRETGAGLAVCAVHPYAVEARENLLAAAAACAVPCLVYLRPGSEAADEYPGLCLRRAAGHEQAAATAVELAQARSGGILLTTGSRHVREYAVAARAGGVRVVARVLDCAESRRALEEAGIPASAAVFGKGPFSVADNCRHLREHSAAVLVSKDSGDAGGLGDKLEAARICGSAVVLVERPAFTGRAYRTIADLVAAIRTHIQAEPSSRDLDGRSA